MIEYFIVLLVSFLVNLPPAFSPPTWLVLNYLYLFYGTDLLMTAVVGVVGTVAGRYVVAKYSGFLLHDWVMKHNRKSLQFLKHKIEKRKGRLFTFSFIWSLSPVPSDALFIVAGTMKLKMSSLIAGFALGRLVGYLALLLVAEASYDFLLGMFQDQVIVFIVLGVIGVALGFMFLFTDWQRVLKNKL